MKTIRYQILVCFKDDKIIQFVSDKYYYDGELYTFTTDINMKIVSCDTVKYITIDKIFV